MQGNKGGAETFFSIFSLTGLKGRMPDNKYQQINTDIKEKTMSTFITAVFAVIYTLIAIGQFIWAIVVTYRGLTWFLTNFDDLPHIWKRNGRYYRRFILRRIWKRIFSH
ncbi:hypothetical protein DFY35_22965 [Escherichia coli]|uniref:Uncharacterized protein n=1 Tax=Escherichia coli TaxID=562 RepID=A0A2H4TL80_ECOLX|nr:hypothetical protein CV83915_3p0017 [Escherichia coli]EMX24607.1 hypothetical protein ECP03018671_5470 [Escherichia coli P0301867.1]ENC86213.1 hypothetical protein ECP030186711_5230 [Escherichia coli P0301867.11]ENE18244.1 hypothetical protein ECP03022933_5095 [Escherichia coli P0302293.3]ENE33784.1 hypothetical protein ECP030229310_5134 [Escherichia coli P0302293.10]